jgi:hypothetical protein
MQTLRSAVVFKARAHLAQKVVRERKAANGSACGSELAHAPALVNLVKSPSLREREEEELRNHMSREESIVDGMRLLQQRLDFVKLRAVQARDARLYTHTTPQPPPV